MALGDVAVETASWDRDLCPAPGRGPRGELSPVLGVAARSDRA